MDKNINECNCFTAGELASLFGISKQTLLYYDKIHLLSPDFIGKTVIVTIPWLNIWI